MFHLLLFSSWPALKCWFHTVIKQNVKVSVLYISLIAFSFFSILKTWFWYSTWTYAMKSSLFTINLWSLYSSAVALLIMDLQ